MITSNTSEGANKYLLWIALAVVVSIGILTEPIATAAVVFLGIILFAFGMTNLAPLTLLLIIAPMRALIATEAPGLMPDIGQMLLVLMLLSWGLHHFFVSQTFPPLTFPRVLFPVAIFVLALFLTFWPAYSKTVWLSEWLKWIQILLVATFVYHEARHHVIWSVFALIVAGLANAIIGYYQFFGGSGALHLLVNNRFFRAFGTFGQPNPFGAFMGLIFPISLMMTVALLLSLFQHRQKFSWQPILTLGFYTLATGILFGGILISWSRGAWLGMLASLMVMLVAFPRKIYQSVALILFAGIAFALLWYAQLLPASIVSRLSSITSELFNVTDVRGVEITVANYAIVERLAHWQAAIRMIESHPWLGVGAGNYAVAYPDYRLINWVEPLGHAHNFYLNVFAETGMIGFTTYIVMWFSVFMLSWQARQHPDPISRAIVIGLMGSWTYFLVHSLTDNLLVNNLFLHLGVMLGILAILSRQSHPKTLSEYNI